MSICSFDCINFSVSDICSIHGPASNEWAHHRPVPASTPDKCAMLSCRGTTLVAREPQHTTCSSRASVCGTTLSFCRSSGKSFTVSYTINIFTVLTTINFVDGLFVNSLCQILSVICFIYDLSVFAVQATARNHSSAENTPSDWIEHTRRGRRLVVLYCLTFA